VNTHITGGGVENWTFIVISYWVLMLMVKGYVILIIILTQPVSADASAIPAAHFGQGHGPVAMNAVNCTGMEGRLDDCNYDSTALTACSHSHDASVQCETECKLFTALMQ